MPVLVIPCWHVEDCPSFSVYLYLRVSAAAILYFAYQSLGMIIQQ